LRAGRTLDVHQKALALAGAGPVAPGAQAGSGKPSIRAAEWTQITSNIVAYYVHPTLGIGQKTF